MAAMVLRSAEGDGGGRDAANSLINFQKILICFPSPDPVLVRWRHRPLQGAQHPVQLLHGLHLLLDALRGALPIRGARRHFRIGVEARWFPPSPLKNGE